MRIAIVGAGIAGLSIARALVRRGSRPTVIARDHGATARGAGIVSAQFWDRALLPLALRGQEIIEGLVPIHRVGMAQIALSRRTARLVDRLPGTAIPPALLRCLRPEFVRRIVSVRFSKREFWIENAALLRALSRDVHFAGGGRIRADRVIFALGASTPGTRIERAALASCDVRVPSMFHVVDTGLYMRENLAGDTTMANIRATLADALGARATFLRAHHVAMAPRPVVRRRGDTWFVGGFSGDGLVLAPAVGEQIAEAVLSS